MGLKGTVKYMEDWYCVYGGLQDIRRTRARHVADCGLYRVLVFVL